MRVKLGYYKLFLLKIFHTVVELKIFISYTIVNEQKSVIITYNFSLFFFFSISYKLNLISNIIFIK